MNEGERERAGCPGVMELGADVWGLWGHMAAMYYVFDTYLTCNTRILWVSVPDSPDREVNMRKLLSFLQSSKLIFQSPKIPPIFVLILEIKSNPF